MIMLLPEASEAVPAGRRARKKRATRLALRAAAIDLTAERGFANVTVEDIADAADVSVRTFFNYFASKEAALVGADPEFLQTLRTDLLALPRSLPPLQALRLVMVARTRAVTDEVDSSARQRGEWLRRLSVVRNDPELAAAQTKHLAALERELAGALVTWLGEGQRSGPYAALLAASVMSALRVAGMCWSELGGTIPLGEITVAALDALGSGLAYDLPGEDAGTALTAAQLFGTGNALPAQRPAGPPAR